MPIYRPLPIASTTASGIVELAIASEVNTGTDSTRAMGVDQFQLSNRNITWLHLRIYNYTIDVATGTTIGGTFEVPFACTITEIGGWVDTAGTTVNQIVDVNKNGTTLMTTNKLSWDSTETSTRTAATAPTLTTTTFAAGDLIAVDVDTAHTTKAKGLVVRLGLRMN